MERSFPLSKFLSVTIFLMFASHSPLRVGGGLADILNVGTQDGVRFVPFEVLGQAADEVSE